MASRRRGGPAGDLLRTSPPGSGMSGTADRQRTRSGMGATAPGGTRARSPGGRGGDMDSTMRPVEEKEENDLSTLPGLEKEVSSMKLQLQSELDELAVLKSSLGELFMRNNCEEYLSKIEKRIQTIENKDIETIQWRIDKVDKVRSEMKKGEHVASPQFSACGLTGFSFHFYPKGDDFAEEGYCSLYFHVPPDTRVTRTLYLGRARHGPAEADTIKNNGVSELCVLTNEIDKATGSIIIGVDGLKVLSSPHIVEQRTKITIKT